MNLITPITEQQLLPLGATPISMATPAHDPANSATAYGNEILEYMSYHIRGSKVFWAEELPLDASPQEFAGLLWHLEHIYVLASTTPKPYSIYNGNCNKTPQPQTPTQPIWHLHIHGSRSCPTLIRLPPWCTRPHALRIIPISYERPYAPARSRQN